MIQGMKKMKRQIMAILMIVCMICCTGLTAIADEAVASDMRLVKTEGTVEVTNKNGRAMSILEDMKLFNGYHLTTKQASYAWMNLDDSKLIKLDAVSEAEIQKKGKDLEVLLNSGNLFFNVTEPLNSDETLNIRTSTMVTGIRGTSGWVKVLNSWTTRVYILEGQVECWGMDPVSGQSKSVILRGGQYADFVVYDQNHVGDKCDIIMGTFTENDIDGFVAIELLNDPDLRREIQNETGMNTDGAANNAPNKLAQEQQAIAQQLQAINEQVKQQEHNVVKDPLFENKTTNRSSSGSCGGGGGGGGSSIGGSSSSNNSTQDTTTTEEELTEITLTLGSSDTDLAATAQNVAYYLAMSTMEEVTVVANSDASVSNVFTFDQAVTVSENQTLIFADGVDVVINSGVTLNITENTNGGTVTVEGGTVTNNGVITNASTHTLNITGALNNNGTINNTGTLKVYQNDGTTAGTINNTGSVFNSGTLNASMVVGTNGKAELQSGGTMSGTLTANADGYALVEVMPASLVIDGGEVELSGVTVREGAMSDLANGQLTVSGGSTVNAATVSGNGNLTVKTGGTVVEVKADGGTVNVAGGTVRAARSDDTTTTAVVNVSSGSLGTMNMAAGNVLNVTGGTVTQVNGTQNSKLNVSGGDIQSVDLLGLEYANADGTVSVTGATGLITVEGGQITSVDLQDYSSAQGVYATTVIAGDTVTSLTQDGGTLEISGGTIGEAVLTNVEFTMSGGSVENMEVKYTDTGTTEGTFTVGGEAEIGTLTLPAKVVCTVDGGTVEKLIAADDVVIHNGTVTTLEETSGDVTIEGGTVGSVSLMSASGIVNGGTVEEGILVNGDGSTLTVNGGTITAPSGGAAIEVNSQVELDENGDPVTVNGTPVYNVTINGGVVDGGDDIALLMNTGYASVGKAATVSAKSVDNLIQVVDNGVAWVDVPCIDTDGGIPTEIGSAQFVICSVSETEYTLKKADVTLNDALSHASNGDTIVVIVEEAYADPYDDAYDIIVAENESVVVDLNGNILYLDTDCYINEVSTEGAKAGCLKIIDGVGTGLLSTSNSFQNSGTLVFTDIDTVFWGDSYNYGEMTIDGGEHEFHCPINIQANVDENGNVLSEGEITVIGGAYLEGGPRMGDGVLDYLSLSPVFTTSLGGIITLGSADDETLVILDANIESSSMEDSAGALIDMLWGTLNLVNVEADASGCPVVYVRGGGDAVGQANIVVNAGAVLKSDYYAGTIVCYDYVKLALNGGIICNDADDGSAIWVKYGFMVDGEPLLSKVGTELYAKNYIVGTETENGILIEYDSTEDGYIRSESALNEGEYAGYYYLEEYTPTTTQAMSLSATTPSNALIAASDSNAEVATDSDATASLGAVTTSQSALPLAAALMAVMMAVPKLFGDEQKKNRKER